MNYPYGSYNIIVKDYLKKVGIKYALTTHVNNFDTTKNNRLEIPRFDANDYKKKF